MRLYCVIAPDNDTHNNLRHAATCAHAPLCAIEEKADQNGWTFSAIYNSVGVGMRPPLPTTTTTNLTKIKWKDEKKKAHRCLTRFEPFATPVIFFFSGFSLPSFSVCVLFYRLRRAKKKTKKNSNHQEHISFKNEKKGERENVGCKDEIFVVLFCVFSFSARNDDTLSSDAVNNSVTSGKPRELRRGIGPPIHSYICVPY